MQLFPVLLVLQGLPGSGKTSEARRICALNSLYKRVNRDDLRALLCCSFDTPGDENIVALLRDNLISQLLLRGYSAVSDDTNFEPHVLARLTDIARLHNAQFRLQRIATPLEECIRRDALREGKARVGEAVIRAIAAKHNIT